MSKTTDAENQHPHSPVPLAFFTWRQVKYSSVMVLALFFPQPRGSPISQKKKKKSFTLACGIIHCKTTSSHFHLCDTNLDLE